MITKVKFKACCDCKDGLEKATIAGRCLYHSRKYRNFVLKNEKEKRKLSPSPISKVENSIAKPTDYSKQLDMWFRYFMVNAKRECENCEASLTHYNEEDWMGSQHHILEKSIYPSVAGNLNNHMVLGKWCCHGQWHTSLENASKMECFELAKIRIRKLLPSLTPEEANRIPEILK